MAFEFWIAACEEADDDNEDVVSALQVNLVQHKQSSSRSAATDREEHSEAEGSSPVSTEELHHLCHVLGLRPACSRLSLISVNSTVDNAAGAECQDIGDKRITFVHVMKAGGTSLDNYLQCRCKYEGCTIQRHDHDHKEIGMRGCPTSMCTLHGKLLNVTDRCGARFAKNTAMFTVLRDPESRVWSFYNYLARWYRPYRENTLMSILLNYGDEDLNEGLPMSETCEHCHKELVNRMTLGNFCGNYTLCKMLEDGSQGNNHVLMAKALDGAKTVLDSMDGVYFQHELDYFIGDYESNPNLFPVTAANPSAATNPSKCGFPASNPSYYRYGDIDEDTAKIIRKMNWADQEFYTYALQKYNLPGRSAPTRMVTGATGSLPFGIKVVMGLCCIAVIFSATMCSKT